MRTLAFWELCWGPLIQGTYHLEIRIFGDSGFNVDPKP